MYLFVGQIIVLGQGNSSIQSCRILYLISGCRLCTPGLQPHVRGDGRCKDGVSCTLPPNRRSVSGSEEIDDGADNSDVAEVVHNQRVVPSGGSQCATPTLLQSLAHCAYTRRFNSAHSAQPVSV